MKNLSTLCFATITMVATAALLHAQGSQSDFNNPNTSAYSNPGNNQPGMSPDLQSQNYMNSRAQNQTNIPNSQWSNQAPVKNQTPKANPYEPYTQPSNLNYSYNPTPESKFWTWSDDEVAQRIRMAIRDDKILSPVGKTTEVTVKDKNVTLSGSVNTTDDKNRISSIAREIPGVKSVSNNIVVTGK